MDLIITEKPNVSKQVKEVLAPYAKYTNLGKGKMPLGYYEDENYVICNTVGHCVEIFAPEEIDSSFGWDLDVLPYNLPKTLPLKISEDKKSLFKTIQTCFSKYQYDKIYVCTDPDREGENIWRKINKMLKPYRANQILRVWIHEWTPEGLRDAFDKAFPDSEKDGLADAATCREEADYIIGMNCSVALTKKYAVGRGNVVSIGRVMGPTMHIVYDREKEIQNFVPEPYTSVSLTTSTDNPNETLTLYMKADKKLTRQEAETVRSIAMGLDPRIELHKTVKSSLSKCPELYDATTIAQDMNKRYGFSAKKTADIIQKLYQDYALTTYPGTNARKISVGSAAESWKILNNLPIYREVCEEIKTNSWQPSGHVVTTEGLAHEAITPVYGSVNPSNVARLTSDERKVYEAICERYLAIFYPKAEIERTTIQGQKTGYTFETSGKVVKEAGWMKILGMGRDSFLPMITDGNMYDITDFILDDKKTIPPARYTEDSLLSAMKNAGNFVEDKEDAKLLNSKEIEGLGTGRTRPAILENIKKRGYFEVKKKTIFPTEKCMALFDILPDTMLSSPSLTAKFERMIQDVEDGNMTTEQYRQFIDEGVNGIIEKVKNDSRGLKISQGNAGAASTSLVCPVCGKPLQENSKAFGCSGWKSGCSFTVWKTIAGKTLTAKQVSDLVSNGRTGLIKGFVGKSGKKFDAYLVLDNDNKIKFEFDNPVKPSGDNGSGGSDMKCPVCGSPMQENSKAFSCSSWRNGCSFTVWKTIAGKTLSKRYVNDLLTKGRTGLIKGFVSKNGKSFDAYLVLGDDNRIGFEFPNKK